MSYLIQQCRCCSYRRRLNGENNQSPTSICCAYRRAGGRIPPPRNPCCEIVWKNYVYGTLRDLCQISVNRMLIPVEMSFDGILTPIFSIMLDGNNSSLIQQTCECAPLVEVTEHNIDSTVCHTKRHTWRQRQIFEIPVAEFMGNVSTISQSITLILTQDKDDDCVIMSRPYLRQRGKSKDTLWL